jgi:Secretion system C-terminal sorting domain
LYGIYFQDANIGWGVSIVGTIFFTTDGGSSWTSQPCGSAFTLREAHFLHQGKGWTVGDNGTIAMFTDNTVPVELNSFSASVTGNNVNLNWSTATETNNRGFEVERKLINGQSLANNSEYQVAGFVYGYGTSTEQHSYFFNDNNLSAGKYLYRIKQIDFDGSFEYYDLASEVTVEAPNTFTLSQNYPNPFNPTTLIKFSIPVKGNVTLKVYDIIGNEVATLVNENKDAGVFEIRFNGEGLSSGLYLYQLKSSTFTKTMKMTLIK